MKKYERYDHYYHKAKQMGLPSRASFKIEELISKYQLAKPGQVVMDLGAAPGGWTAILAPKVGKNGMVAAIDLENLSTSFGPQVKFIQADMMDPAAHAQLMELLLPKTHVDAIFSDMSPKLSGITFRDAYLSYELVCQAHVMVNKFLKAGGHFVFKIFPGSEAQALLKQLKSEFKKVHVIKPEASRKTSKEEYVVCLEYKK